MSGEDQILTEDSILGIERPTPEQEAAVEQVRKEKAELRRRFLYGLLENPMFREWMMEQLHGFNTFGQPYAASPNGFPDEMATQFQMGLKAAGWHIWEIFDEVSPELASLMRREANQRK